MVSYKCSSARLEDLFHFTLNGFHKTLLMFSKLNVQFNPLLLFDFNYYVCCKSTLSIYCLFTKYGQQSDVSTLISVVLNEA
jgi:hypothetical protein